MVDNFDITKKGPSSSLNQFPIRSKGKQSTTGRDSNYRVKKELSAKKSYPKRNFNRYKYQFKVASKKTINLYDPPSNASNDDPNDQSSSIEEFIIDDGLKSTSAFTGKKSIKLNKTTDSNHPKSATCRYKPKPRQNSINEVSKSKETWFVAKL